MRVNILGQLGRLFALINGLILIAIGIFFLYLTWDYAVAAVRSLNVPPSLWV